MLLLYALVVLNIKELEQIFHIQNCSIQVMDMLLTRTSSFERVVLTRDEPLIVCNKGQNGFGLLVTSVLHIHRRKRATNESVRKVDSSQHLRSSERGKLRRTQEFHTSRRSFAQES